MWVVGVGTPTRVIGTLIWRNAKGLLAAQGSAPIDAGWRDDHHSVVLPSKCSVDASASALVAAFNPSRCWGGL